MKNFLALFFLLVLALDLCAHDYPIFPVKIKADVRQDMINLTVQSNANYWKDRILGSGYRPLPVHGWEEVWVERADEYLQDHIELFVDDQPLKGLMTSYAYHEEPMRSFYGYVEFVLSYPYPTQGKVLKGKSQFFNWYYHIIHERESYDSHAEEEDHKKFETHIQFSGPKKLELVLPFDEPHFEVPLEDVLITRWEYARRFLFKSWVHPFGANPFSLFILLMFLFNFEKKHYLVGVGVFVLAAMISFYSGIFPQRLSPVGLGWLAVVVLGVLSPPVRSFPLWLGGVGFSGLLWGLIWNQMPDFSDLPQNVMALGRITFLFGSFVLFFVFGLLVLIIKDFYHRSLMKKSKQAAQRVYHTHLGFLARVLLVISLFQFVRTSFLIR